jgi:type IV pilus assembly protein PilV
MVSIGVMTIGAMAIMAMQQQAARANVHARELTVATQIAQTWIERLKVDSMRWTTVTGVPATDLAGTDVLRTVFGTSGGGGTALENVFTPLQLAVTSTMQTQGGVSGAFDYFGRDVLTDISNPANMANVRYCAAVRFTWVYYNRQSPVSDDRALRADVRVWWPNDVATSGNKSAGNSIAADFPACGTAAQQALLNPGTGGTELNNYHVVYLSTVLRPMGR